MPGEAWSFSELKALWDLVVRVRRWFAPNRTSEKHIGDTEQTEQREVLILGPGGVGKTTFGRLISLDYDFRFDSPGGYEESIGVDTFTIADDEQVEIVVLPGQKHRRDSSWTDVLEEIKNGRFRGIMLFSAYGHHSLGEISFKSLELYEKCGRRKRDFLSAYFESKRRDELDVLRRLQPYIETSSNPLWLLSVVAKQDLWWSERQSVERFYRYGEYGAIIASLANKRGAETFQHEFAFTSLVIQNLTSGQNEVLKKKHSRLRSAPADRVTQKTGRNSRLPPQMGASAMTARTSRSRNKDVGEQFVQAVVPLMKEYTQKLECIVQQAEQIHQDVLRGEVDGSRFRKSAQEQLGRIRNRATRLASSVQELIRRVSQMVEHGQLDSEVDRVELKLRLADLEIAIHAAKQISAQLPKE